MTQDTDCRKCQELQQKGQEYTSEDEIQRLESDLDFTSEEFKNQIPRNLSSVLDSQTQSGQTQGTRIVRVEAESSWMLSKKEESKDQNRKAGPGINIDASYVHDGSFLQDIQHDKEINQEMRMSRSQVQLPEGQEHKEYQQEGFEEQKAPEYRRFSSKTHQNETQAQQKQQQEQRDQTQIDFYRQAIQSDEVTETEMIRLEASQMSQSISKPSIQHKKNASMSTLKSKYMQRIASNASFQAQEAAKKKLSQMSVNKTVLQSNSSSEIQPELILELEKENMDLQNRKNQLERGIEVRKQEMERKRAIMFKQIEELKKKKQELAERVEQ